jgi:hypothetical protein
MGVGDAEGVGGRAEPTSPGFGRRGGRSSSEHEHGRAFAEDESVAVAVEGARGGLVRRCVLRAVSKLKPVTPNGWIIVWVPPESITSASPRRMISTASRPPANNVAGG